MYFDSAIENYNLFLRSSFAKLDLFRSLVFKLESIISDAGINFAIVDKNNKITQRQPNLAKSDITLVNLNS